MTLLATRRPGRRRRGCGFSTSPGSSPDRSAPASSLPWEPTCSASTHPGRRDMAPGALADTLLGKRSCTLDLTTPAGDDLVHALLDQADVLVHGYRPGALDRFGLSPQEIAERHPGTVVVIIDAWGHRARGRRVAASTAWSKPPPGLPLASLPSAPSPAPFLANSSITVPVIWLRPPLSTDCGASTARAAPLSGECPSPDRLAGLQTPPLGRTTDRRWTRRGEHSWSTSLRTATASWRLPRQATSGPSLSVGHTPAMVTASTHQAGTHRLGPEIRAGTPAIDQLRRHLRTPDGSAQVAREPAPAAWSGMIDVHISALTGRLVRLEPLEERHIDGLYRACTEDRASYSHTSVPQTWPRPATTSPPCWGNEKPDESSLSPRSGFATASRSELLGL